ncbi:MAG TPA: zinc metalloprotease HtpX, partial [Candidatus Dormibacteraeota bacterium]|nr:zinc metalloprotease HtpX [Candidatus Dormibacteraeota bacterium]
KTAFLLALLDGLFIVVGGVVLGRAGILIGLVVGVLANAVSYWNSDKIAIAVARGVPVTPQQAPELHRIVDELCREANMPKPRVYVCDDPSPNAFATGRNPSHAAVCCTSGILNLVTARELRGVLGHELAHVRNRDILTASVAATIAAGIGVLAQLAMLFSFFGGGRDERDGGNPLMLLLVAILAAPAAAVIQLAISRSREYQADRSGAQLTHDPLALANALRKLDAQTRRIPMQVAPAVAPLFIVNPFGGRSVALSSLFSTHPPLEDRIRRLEQMATSAG